MPRILILFASTHGHTAKIAARIAAVLEGDGASVDLHEIDAHPTQPAPSAYDAVVVDASVHAEHHQRALVKWAEQHHSALGLIPSAFFSVCLTAADDTEESRAATRAYRDEFVEQTGWTPDQSVTFAGALQDREYSVATRALVRLLMRRIHHPTGTSQDYDYTDWDAVERWARELAATLTPKVQKDRQMESKRLQPASRPTVGHPSHEAMARVDVRVKDIARRQRAPAPTGRVATRRSDRRTTWLLTCS